MITSFYTAVYDVFEFDPVNLQDHSFVGNNRIQIELDLIAKGRP